MKSILSKTMLAMAITTSLVACSNDSDNKNSNAKVKQPIKEKPTPKEPAEPAKTTKITYGLKLLSDDGKGTEYLVDRDEVTTGTLTAQGVGEEQLGWNFFYPTGKTVFVMGYNKLESRAYTIDANNDLTLLSSFSYDRALEMFGNIDSKTLLASTLSRKGTSDLILYTADATSGKALSKVTYTVHPIPVKKEDTDSNAETKALKTTSSSETAETDNTIGVPTALVVRDNQLFVPYQKLDNEGNYTSPDASTAYVAIFDYPVTNGAVPKKVIKDERTGNLGVNGMVTAMIKTEKNDLYTYSNGKASAGFSPASTKPSGILRIKAGKSEFDADYFFNIEEATNGGSLFWFDYIGNNKAIARILTDEKACKAVSEKDDAACAWAAYGKKFMNQKLVVIDLVAKTVTDVEGVPLHAKRYTSPITIIDGKVYLSIEVADADGNVDNNVYIYDIATGKATKGAAIEGKTIKGFYNLN